MVSLVFSMDISYLPFVLFLSCTFWQCYFQNLKSMQMLLLWLRATIWNIPVSGNLRRHFAFDSPCLPIDRAASGLLEGSQSMKTWGWSFEEDGGVGGWGWLRDLSSSVCQIMKATPLGGPGQQRHDRKGYSSHKAVSRSPQLIRCPRSTVDPQKYHSGCHVLCGAPSVYLVWCWGNWRRGESHQSKEHWGHVSIVHIQCFCALFWTHKNFSIMKENKYRWQRNAHSLITSPPHHTYWKKVPFHW